MLAGYIMVKLKKIIIDISKKFKPIGTVYKGKTIITHFEGVTFQLMDDGVDLYQELLNDIAKNQKYQKKFSEVFINKKIQSVFSHLIKTSFDERNIDDELRKLFDYFDNYNTSYRVLVPLANLQIEDEKYEAGVVTLYKGTVQKIDKILEDIRSVVLTTENSEDGKLNTIESQSSMIINTFSNRVFSEYIVCAEPTRAKERAIEETRRVIDVLRFSIAALYDEAYKVNIAINGEIIQNVRHVSMISTDKKHFSFGTDSVGAFLHYEINNKTIKILKDIGVNKLFNILKKEFESLTEFEKTIFRTIHWYASHTIQDEIENKLLNLITSLETLLTPRDGNPIGNAIAEGAAIIYTEGIENRRKIKKRIQVLYRTRSAVSHGGKKSVTEQDIFDLKFIIRNIISILIEKLSEINTQRDLLNWIEDKKFK